MVVKRARAAGAPVCGSTASPERRVDLRDTAEAIRVELKKQVDAITREGRRGNPTGWRADAPDYTG